MGDEDGETPLYVSAFQDQAEVGPSLLGRLSPLPVHYPGTKSTTIWGMTVCSQCTCAPSPPLYVAAF